jgi:hypothetical protein
VSSTVFVAICNDIFIVTEKFIAMDMYEVQFFKCVKLNKYLKKQQIVIVRSWTQTMEFSLV